MANMRHRSPLPLGGADNNDIGGDSSSTSRHVYVHHINEQQQPQQQAAAPQYAPQPPQYYPQPQVMPMPVPMPMPMPMFGGCGGGGGYGHYQQPPQPPVIVVNGGGGNSGGRGGDVEKAAKKDDGGGDSGGGGGGGGKTKPKTFSAVMLASTIFCIIGSLLGFICVGKVYDVFEHSLDNNNNNNNNESDYFIINRTVALSVGAAAILLFWISFMLAFYAGMKYKIKHGKGSSKDGKCCRDGLFIAGLVLFGLTFMNNLIILVLAFDDGARIYPEAVLSAVFGSIAAWLCVFGWAELVRRS